MLKICTAHTHSHISTSRRADEQQHYSNTLKTTVVGGMVILANPVSWSAALGTGPQLAPWPLQRTVASAPSDELMNFTSSW